MTNASQAMNGTTNELPAGLGDALLLRAMRQRRSKRFAPGMTLATGPLSYSSVRPPAPLTEAEEAALAFAACNYLFERYGRFPVSSAPFRTVLAFQAHRLDPDFYSRFYRTDAVD